MFTPQRLLIGMAVLIAVCYLPALVSPKKFRKALRGATSDRNLVRVMGGLWLLIAFMFLSVHWKFTAKWYMTVSILGWLMLLKGLAWIWFPDFVKKNVRKIGFLNSSTGLTILGVIGLLIAAFLVYIALELLTIEQLVMG